MPEKRRLRVTNPEEFRRRRRIQREKTRLDQDRSIQRGKRREVRFALSNFYDQRRDLVVIPIVEETSKTEKIMLSRGANGGYVILDFPTIPFESFARFCYEKSVEENDASMSEEKLLLSFIREYLCIGASSAQVIENIIVLKGAHLLETARKYYIEAIARPNEFLYTGNARKVATIGKWDVYGYRAIGQCFMLKRISENMLMVSRTIFEIISYRVESGKLSEEERLKFYLRYEHD